MSIYKCNGIEVEKDACDISKIETRFRVFNVKNGKMAYGDDVKEVEEGYLELSTGFKDRNGTEIYAGDIVSIGDYKAFVSTAMDGSWMCDGERECDYFVGDECKWSDYEVVGHSYDGITKMRYL